MNKNGSMTAKMALLGRAYINKNCEEPIFTDNVAKKLFKAGEMEQMEEYIFGGADFFLSEEKSKFETPEKILDYIIKTQIAPTPIARSRFCEDSLRCAVLTGVTQYVILGAGYDTFAFRQGDLRDRLSIFEVDCKETQMDKIDRIKDAGLEIPENLKFISMDFTKDRLQEKLIEGGFDKTKKTFFSWLGVTYYLSEKQVENMFCGISEFALEGSSVVFDYGDTNMFNSKASQVNKMVALAKSSGEPMKYCTDIVDLQIILERYEFLIYESLSDRDIEQRYFKNRDDDFHAFQSISYCHAVLGPKKLKNTKERILNSALMLFSKFGYEGVSVRDISGSLGITQGALYKHYKNKQDIFDNIVSQMEQEDAKRAGHFDVPEDLYDKMPAKYANTPLKNIFSFTLAQFDYWTGDPFATAFRKMITIEQYRNNEMKKLFSMYLGDGPLGYIKDLFCEIYKSRGEALALEFYSVFYFSLLLSDKDEDKRRVRDGLQNYIVDFSRKNEE